MSAKFGRRSSYTVVLRLELQNPSWRFYSLRESNVLIHISSVVCLLYSKGSADSVLALATISLLIVNHF